MRMGISGSSDPKEPKEQESTEQEKQQPKAKNGIVVIIVLVAFVILAFVIFSFANGGDDEEDTSYEVVPTVTPVPSTEPNSVSQVDPDEFLDEVEYNEIEENYVVEEITTKRDFINYEKRSATIDSGMEMYWIEVVYEERDYRMQIPYSVYRTMDDKGICIAEIEVCTLAGGGELVTYMSIVENYRDFLE